MSRLRLTDMQDEYLASLIAEEGEVRFYGREFTVSALRFLRGVLLASPDKRYSIGSGVFLREHKRGLEIEICAREKVPQQSSLVSPAATRHLKLWLIDALEGHVQPDQCVRLLQAALKGFRKSPYTTENWNNLRTIVDRLFTLAGNGLAQSAQTTQRTFQLSLKKAGSKETQELIFVRRPQYDFPTSVVQVGDDRTAVFEVPYLAKHLNQNMRAQLLGLYSSCEMRLTHIGSTSWVHVALVVGHRVEAQGFVEHHKLVNLWRWLRGLQHGDGRAHCREDWGSECQLNG